MRVYLPSTLAALAGLQSSGCLAAPSGVLQAHAVTAAMREWYIEGDLEELEYAAMTEAAEASLRLIAQDPAAPRRRVVLAADVADDAVRPRSDDRFRSSVLLTAAIPVAAMASVHVDEGAAAQVVAEAIAALERADAGDDDARFVLDSAEATELLWYDVSELPDLI